MKIYTSIFKEFKHLSMLQLQEQLFRPAADERAVFGLSSQACCILGMGELAFCSLLKETFSSVILQYLKSN